MKTKINIFNKKNVFYIIPVSLTIILFLHVLVDSIIYWCGFSSKPWFQTDWSYVETGFFAFILSLCNSIPFFYVVYKSKNTKSYSTYTLCANVFTGLIGVLNYCFNFKESFHQSLPVALICLRWIPDIFTNIISW